MKFHFPSFARIIFCGVFAFIASVYCAGNAKPVDASFPGGATDPAASTNLPLVRTPSAVKISRTSPDGSVPVTPAALLQTSPAANRRATVFSIPLCALGGSGAEEETVLDSTLKDYSAVKTDRRLSIIESYLSSHPHSVYRASLSLNLGLNAYHSAYFSKALTDYLFAWTSAKDDPTESGRIIADRAFGELVHLHARLGHFQELQSLFSNVGDRVFRGASTELVAGARQGLWMMLNRPEDAFKCGPAALYCIYSLEHPLVPVPPEIGKSRSTQKGMSLVEVCSLANKIGLKLQMAKRSPGATLIYPSVIHWKVGHYASLLSSANGITTFKDPTFNATYSASKDAIDSEGSGYYLVPEGPLPKGWTSVSAEEGGTIWGRGQSFLNDPNRTRKDDKRAKPCEGKNGMTVANVVAMVCSLNLSDVPVGYAPPFGPAVAAGMEYNQREASQPDVFNYTNWGNKWSSDWVGYISIVAVEYSDGNNGVLMEYPVVHLPGGGEESYVPPVLDLFSPLPIEPTSHCWMTRNSDSSWTRNAPDGSKIVFSKTPGVAIPGEFITDTIAAMTFDGYFISTMSDPAGNVLTFSYDFPTVNSALAARLKNITDPLGLVTTLSYGISADVLKVTQITDPFNRSAQFSYDSSGRLITITDVLGIASQYTYQGTGDFINSLTTPYGTSTFSYGEPNIDRWVEMTDPLGNYERVEFPQAPVFSNGPAITGMTSDWFWHNVTYYWDKKATHGKLDTALAVSDAIQYHWLGSAVGSMASGTLDAIQRPLENPIHYNYPNQTDFTKEGISALPIKIGRSLDDGSSQVYSYAYNSIGKVTDQVDPLGRETSYVIESDPAQPGYLIDLREIDQKTGASTSDVLMKATYNAQHLPLQVSDAAGQTTLFTYNAVGQVATVTDAKGQVTTYWYHRTGNPSDPDYPYNASAARDPDATGFLVKIDGPQIGTFDTVGMTYDAFGRVRTVTDTEGYTVTTDYDAFDRPTVVTYPDGTYQQYIYDRLDVSLKRDRRGLLTQFHYNPLRQLVLIQNPKQEATQFMWCGCGELAEIIDPLGHITDFGHDVDGRLTSKTFQDNKVIRYSYEATTGRLKSVTDALNQTVTFQYNLDNTPSVVSYTNAVNPTPGVSFTYDSIYPRLSAMIDQLGTTLYTYNPVPLTPTLGAGRLSSVSGPLANAVITYTYDELGRVLTQSINGTANQTSLHYDALGRTDQLTNVLGTFGYTYLNMTGRLDHISYPNNQRTNYTYYPISSVPAGNGDQRLNQIQNLTPASANLSSFTYAYDAAGVIQTLLQQNDAAPALSSNFQYDPADQLTGAAVQKSDGTSQNFIYRYDAAGNRTSEQIDSGVSAASLNSVNQLTGLSPSGPIRFAGTLSEPATATVNGVNASVDASNHFSADVPLAPGTQTVSVTATDYSLNTATKNYQVVVASGLARSPVYDLNGNMTNDGNGRVYAWDAVNRLISITQGSNVTGFVYDGAGRRTQETLNGTVIKQWVWSGGAQPSEERDASNVVTKRFFGGLGEQIGSISYFLSTDHLGSVREMTDSTGAVRARYSYDPYGRQTKVSGDLDSDFGYAGYFKHQASGLNLMLYRAYDPDLGRFLSRDPSGEDGGLNLYGYVGNNPINAIDPLGLYGLWDLGSDTLNFAAGLGNAVSFGGTTYLAKRIDEAWMGPGAAAEIQRAKDCSGAFKAGEWASLALGTGRLAYAGIAKGASLVYAAEGASMAEAEAAIVFRNGLKQAFRLNPWSTFRVYPISQIAAKYGTPEAIIAAAGRTNTAINLVGAGAAAGGATTLSSDWDQ